MSSVAREKSGRIITFYSYKGGTGRTMALANVACLLAETSPVLVVDWDLEAPGLHRFFPPRLRPSIDDAGLGLDETPGLIDLFRVLRDALPASVASDEDESDRRLTEAFATLALDQYIRPTAVPNVAIMRAGRNDDGEYSRRVSTFDWEALFARAPAAYRVFGEQLAARYGFVLIDSRTGVTDISGICTALLPEQLIVVFTPNQQSLTGVRELVVRAMKYRRSSDDLRPLLVFPLPSRIEPSLQDLRALWRFGDVERGVSGYQPMFQELLASSYGLSTCDLSGYFDDVQIQQTPDYAYGEEIAVRRTGDRFSMANSYAVFVHRLTSGQPPWAARTAPREEAAPVPPVPAPTDVEAPRPGPAPPVARPSEVVVPPSDVSILQPRPPRPAAPPRPEPRRQVAPGEGSMVFLSYAREDRERVEAIARHLEKRGLRVWWDRDIAPGVAWGEVVSRMLDESAAVVVCWSDTSVRSRWVVTEAEEGLRRGILVPVLLDDVSPPLTFRSVQSADLRRPTSEAMERFTEIVARVADASPGTITYAPPSISYAPPSMAAPETRRARPVWTIPMAVAASLVVLIAGGFFSMRFFQSATNPSDAGTAPVTVPNFVGTASSDVVKAAELIGLMVVMSDGSGAQAPFLDGVITSQSPAAGATVARASRVELRVATRTVPVPTLVGTTLNSALDTLERSSLRLGKTETQPVRDAKPGTIIRQSPEAGAGAAAGATVDVVVAATPPVQRPVPSAGLVLVPDLIGLTAENADTALTRAGLREGRSSTRRAPAYARVGTIIGQSPAADTQVQRGTSVDVVIAGN